MEVVFNFSLGNGLPVVTLLLIFLFSFAYGFLVNGIALLMPLKANRIFKILYLQKILTLVKEYIMSFKDIFKKSFLEGYSGAEITSLLHAASAQRAAAIKITFFMVFLH